MAETYSMSGRLLNGNRVSIELNITTVDKKGRLDWETLLPVETPVKVVSICGDEFEPNKRRSHVSGQINMSISPADVDPAYPNLKRVFELWDTFHLNGTRPGSKLQEAWLKENGVSGWANDYDNVCKNLADAGLNPDRGYKFGSQWLVEQIPEEKIGELVLLFVNGGE